jgi:hypothetical protein
MTYDSINPNHYRGGRQFEPIEVIEDWGLDYHLGNALKYIARNGRKPGENPCEGLNKAIWYLERAVDQYVDAAREHEQQEEVEFQAMNEIPSTLLFGTDEDQVPFAATHEDIIEFDSWDPSLGPIEPDLDSIRSTAQPDVDDQPLDGWDCSAWGSWAARDDYKQRECRTLDKHKILYTSKEGGWIYGHQKNGDVRIIGTYGARAMGQEVEEDADNAPSEFEPLHDS